MSSTDQPATNAVRRYTVNRRLTRGNVRGAAQTSRWYAAPMELIARDLDIVRLVQAFRQVHSGHVQAAFFHDHALSTMHNVLRRLVKRKLIYPVSYPLPGGPKGGRGRYVYALGSEGWRLFYNTRWYAPTAVDYHALAVADAYAAALDYEHQGVIKVERVDVESYDVLGRTDLRPDLVLRFGIIERRIEMLRAIEVDLATELRPTTIRAKIDKYAAAYRESETDFFPRVVFLVPDKRRADWIQRIINEASFVDDEGKQMVNVYTMEQWPATVI